MAYDYGPLRTYEITWRDRPPEMVQGHQVILEDRSGLFDAPNPNPRFTIHGMFPQGWRLVITAQQADIISIRDVTEQVAALEAMAVDDGV